MCKLCQIPSIQASRHYSESVVKIKYRGAKITIKEMLPTDIIDDKCLYQNEWSDGVFGGKWYRSQVVGDKVSDHPTRKYVRIISPWYK